MIFTTVLKTFYFIIRVSISYICGGGAQKPEIGYWGHVELELRVIVSCLTRALGAELGSSRKAYTLSLHRSKPSPTVFMHIACCRNDQMS